MNYQDKNITGKYIRLNLLTNQKNNLDHEEHHKFLQNKLKPIGLCLYTNRKYHILRCVMTGYLELITDDLEYFDEETKDYFDKGKCRNEDCWTVLSDIQSDIGYQSWSSMFPEIMNEKLN